MAYPLPESNRLLTITQAAAIKAVTPRTVRSWISRGLLRAERTGPRLIRIRQADLEAMGQAIGVEVA